MSLLRVAFDLGLDWTPSGAGVVLVCVVSSISLVCVVLFHGIPAGAEDPSGRLLGLAERSLIWHEDVVGRGIESGGAVMPIVDLGWASSTAASSSIMESTNSSTAALISSSSMESSRRLGDPSSN